MLYFCGVDSTDSAIAGWRFYVSPLPFYTTVLNLCQSLYILHICFGAHYVCGCILYVLHKNAQPRSLQQLFCRTVLIHVSSSKKKYRLFYGGLLNLLFHRILRVRTRFH